MTPQSSRNHRLWLIVAINQANKLVAKRLKMWTRRPDSICCNFAVVPFKKLLYKMESSYVEEEYGVGNC